MIFLSLPYEVVIDGWTIRLFTQANIPPFGPVGANARKQGRVIVTGGQTPEEAFVRIICMIDMEPKQ